MTDHEDKTLAERLLDKGCVAHAELALADVETLKQVPEEDRRGALRLMVAERLRASAAIVASLGSPPEKPK
jgi:hypothetical protein